MKISKLTREDCIEALEAALSSLDDALSELKNLPECSGAADDICEISGGLQEQLDELKAEAEREYAEMMAEATRDYWRAVI